MGVLFGLFVVFLLILALLSVSILTNKRIAIEVKKMKKKEVDFREQEKSDLKEMEKEKGFKTAMVWKQKLEELGEEPDFTFLLEQANRKSFVETEIPFKAVMNQEEYRSILLKLEPELQVKDFNSDGYSGSFRFEALASAIHSVKLSLYLDALEESIQLLNKKENVHPLSEAAQEKRESLRSEHKEKMKELLSIISFEDLPPHHKRLTFSEIAIVDESALLAWIDSNVESKHPLSKPKVSSKQNNQEEEVVEDITSPALTALTAFLSENELPDDVRKELEDTMGKIEDKLQEQKKEDAYEKLLLDAKVLNITSKDYHQLS